ncbi:mannose-6-phosphate isomerase, class I [Canibacter sp. lx-45]|nr:mannose-6-phosphate isomerase, class I [Canibacter zhuwentaonis]MBT1035066.1 mannose-6-phosphate isomerase, class I [Canibacter zhuwentaonis]
MSNEILAIRNKIMPYKWGMIGGISSRLKYDKTAQVEAELWIGAHPKAPSEFVAQQNATSNTLLDYEKSSGQTLPFLLKLLAVNEVLSLQAHPTKEQAAVGHAAENKSEVPFNSPVRNYPDAQAKPEVLVALESGFEALCGFRQALDSVQVFEALGAHPSLRKAARDVIKEYIRMLRGEGISGVVTWALEQQAKRIAEIAAAEERAALTADNHNADPLSDIAEDTAAEAIKNAAETADDATEDTAGEAEIDIFHLRDDELIGVLKTPRIGRGRLIMQEVLAALQEAALTHTAIPLPGNNPQLTRLVTLLLKLNSQYPQDAGIVVASLLNHLTLAPGEALWIPPGTLHAYVHGYGVEVMSPSDNVLRGGLTVKHVNPAELAKIIDFNGSAAIRFIPETNGKNSRYAPDQNGEYATPFELVRVLEDCVIESDFPLSVLVVNGKYEIVARGSKAALKIGDSVFIPGGKVSLTGSGEAYVATGQIKSWR